MDNLCFFILLLLYEPVMLDYRQHDKAADKFQTNSD